MNLGLTTSFIIGGLLLLTIGIFNMRLGQHSTELTLHQISKAHVEGLYQTVQNDLNKVGYNVLPDEPGCDSGNWMEPELLLADSSRIAFSANISGNPGSCNNIPTVMWELTEEEIAGSRNPDHRVLQRIESQFMEIDTPNHTVVTGAEEEEVESIELGVTRLEFRYYTADSNTPLNTPVPDWQLEMVQRIEVILELEPREGIRALDGGTRFPVTQWQKIIVPQNLNLEEE